MANEVVKHHNDLNTVIMRKWTAEEMNFFFAIIAKARDKGTSDLVFNKNQLAELADYSIQHNKRLYDTMDSLANNISQLRYIEKTSNSIEYMPLFTRFRVDWKEDLSDMQAKVSVSPHFEYILNRLSANFTQYELKEFTTIRSTYAKTAYRLLKQWRTVGRKEFAIDEFKLLMDMPASYKACHIDRLVINPIKKQLSPYFVGLKVKKIKSNKRGNPVLGYEFTWQKEVTEAYDPNKYDKPKTATKKPSKKANKKSNVPKWSNPDYENPLDPKIIDELIEFHKLNGTLDTPGAQKEIADKKKEIEEGRAKLEAQKQALLARLDKSSEPDVVPGQTDIYDFLDEEENEV